LLGAQPPHARYMHLPQRQALLGRHTCAAVATW
jgi:hypothetical protein